MFIWYLANTLGLEDSRNLVAPRLRSHIPQWQVNKPQ